MNINLNHACLFLETPYKFPLPFLLQQFPCGIVFHTMTNVVIEIARLRPQEDVAWEWPYLDSMA